MRPMDAVCVFVVLFLVVSVLVIPGISKIISGDIVISSGMLMNVVTRDDGSFLEFSDKNKFSVYSLFVAFEGKQLFVYYDDNYYDDVILASIEPCS